MQMTYVYKKSEHHDVAHSLFRNFEMANSVNNELRKAVLRLAARARHGRNPNWQRRLRRMSRENLITQLRLVLRQTGYRARVRFCNAFAHSRQVQTVIEDNVFERRLGGLHVFRGISLAREERLGKSKNIIFFKIIYLDFLFTYFLFIALESLLRDDSDTDSDSTFFEENSIAASPQHSARTAGILNHAARRHLDTDSDSITLEQENPIVFEGPQHAVRAADTFNPVARRLKFTEVYSDTGEAEEKEGEAGEAAAEQAVNVRMAEDEPPESPALIDWERFDYNQDADSEPDEERAARNVADDRRLEELLIMHADIADTLVTYERPLVTYVERILLLSQPPGVSAEDRSTAADTLRVNRENQQAILQDVANAPNATYNHDYVAHRRVNECKYKYLF